MLEFVAGIFVGAAALPWLWLGVLILFCLIDVALTEKEAFGWATLFIFGGLGLVAWLGAGINPVSWVWNHLAELALLIPCYLAVGGLWSVFKWWRYLVKLAQKIRDEHTRFKKSPIGKLDAEEGISVRPKRPRGSYASENKQRIVGWIAHWPFSMVGSLIGDVLVRLFEWTFDLLRSTYDRVSTYVFSDFDDE